jgi:hypothetical protein
MTNDEGRMGNGQCQGVKPMRGFGGGGGGRAGGSMRSLKVLESARKVLNLAVFFSTINRLNRCL